MGSKISILFEDPENENLLKKVYHHYDKDHNGSLDLKEFQSFSQDVVGYITKKSKKDPEKLKGSGFVQMLPKGMIKGIKANKREINQFAEKLFNEVDKDHNGEISFGEFKQWCQDKQQKDPVKKRVQQPTISRRSSSIQFIQALKQAKELSLKEQRSKETEKTKLEQRVGKHNLYMNENIDHQGDCLFDSVSDQLKLNHDIFMDKDEVRMRLIEWLQSNRDYKISDEGEETLENWINITQGITWEDYIQKMSKPRVWGDEIMIKAITELFYVKIVIYSSTVSEEHFISEHFPKGKEGQKLKSVKLAHFLENHYTSLLTLDQVLEMREKMISMVSSFFRENIKEESYISNLKILFRNKLELNDGDFKDAFEHNEGDFEASLTDLVLTLGDFTVYDFERLQNELKVKMSI